MRGRILPLARRLAGSIWFRVVMTAVLLALAFSRVEWGTINDRLRAGSPTDGALAVLLVLAALVIGGLRWQVLLRVADLPVRRRELFRVFSVSAFANAFLPTSVGGDFTRVLMVGRRGEPLARAATTVVIDRLASVASLVMMAWLGVLLAPHVVSSGSTAALAAVSVGMLVAILVLRLRPGLLRSVGARVVPARFMTHVGAVAAVVGAFLTDRRAFAAVVLSSLAFQALATIQIVFLARMVGVELSFGLAAVALALTQLATLLPISIGGFGVREGSYAIILAGGGVSHTDAVLISLLSIVALFVATLPGAWELVRGGFSPVTPEIAA